MEHLPTSGSGRRFDEMPAAALGAPPELEDYADNPTLYGLLARLPRELRQEHLRRIEHLEDEEAEGYLYALHERRNEALRESEVSDEQLRPYFDAHQERVWEALETRVFTDEENFIRAGTTARIKRFDPASVMGEDVPVPPLAVKYLVSPNDKTLSASGEHDMILEVEQIQAIERAGIRAMGEDARVRVPHPYFSYHKGRIQCYGMELIDGVNLEQGRVGGYDPALKEAFRESFGALDREALMRDVDAFFDAMHGICLHGDIKPRNLMVSQDGRLYVIDFGQAVLATNVDERSLAAFEELKEMEKRNTKDALRYFLDTL